MLNYASGTPCAEKHDKEEAPSISILSCVSYKAHLNDISGRLWTDFSGRIAEAKSILAKVSLVCICAHMNRPGENMHVIALCHAHADVVILRAA